MKYLEYYFQLEFQWKNDWFSKSGIPKPIIRPSIDFIQQNKYVDFNIIESVFISGIRYSYSDWLNKLDKIKNDLSHEGQSYIGNETAGLEIKIDFCRPIDNLGDEIGIEAPLSWNLAIPLEFQYIPTLEIIQLFDDWCEFLSVIENRPPSV